MTKPADEWVPIHQGQLHELKRLQEAFESARVEAEIVRPPYCTGSS